MTIDKHNCTKEEFYVLAKTKIEPVLDNVPEAEFKAITAYPSTVELEKNEIGSVSFPLSEAKKEETPEPKKSWKKVKAAK